jgi:hypothetical protein
MAFGPGKLFPPLAGVFTGGLAMVCAWLDSSAMPKTDNVREPRRFPDGEIIDSEFLVHAVNPSTNRRRSDILGPEAKR